MQGQHELADLAPRDVVAKAITRRMHETGHPHMWLDARHLGAEFWERRVPDDPRQTCRSHGVDPVTELIPVAPACHYASGGVRHRPVGPHRRARPLRHRRGRLLGRARRQPARLQLAARGAGLLAAHRRGAARRAAAVRRPGPRRPARRAGRRPTCAATLQAVMTARVGRAAPADGLAEAALMLDELAGGRRPTRSAPAPGRRPTCSRSAPRSPARPRCARRRAAPTGARTSPTATTRTGRATSTSAGPTAGRARPSDPAPHRPRRETAVTTAIARTPYDAPPARAARRARRRPASTPARSTTTSSRALEEDLPGGEDVTSAATIPADARGTADFAAREPGVVAGLGGRRPGVRLRDGRRGRGHRPAARRHPRSRPATWCMRVSGPTRGLLTAERTALNFASHLSGVATATAAWVDALEGTQARVLDTRKTLPDFRALQKYAVRCGGGVNHRFSLSDLAMVKDNHVLAAGGVVPAYRGGARGPPGPPGRGRGDRPRPAARAARRRVRADPARQHGPPRDGRGGPRRSGADGRATLEASGGLTLERAREVAETGVDFISVGALTHSVHGLRPRYGPAGPGVS